MAKTHVTSLKLMEDFITPQSPTKAENHGLSTPRINHYKSKILILEFARQTPDSSDSFATIPKKERPEKSCFSRQMEAKRALNFGAKISAKKTAKQNATPTSTMAHRAVILAI